MFRSQCVNILYCSSVPITVQKSIIGRIRIADGRNINWNASPFFCFHVTITFLICKGTGTKPKIEIYRLQKLVL
jgi:hypothetical protein